MLSYYSLHFLVSWNKSFRGKGNIAKNLKLDICAGKVWNSSDKTFWYKDHPSWFSVLYQLLRFTDLPPLYQMHRKWRTRHTRKKTANPQGALTRTEEVCVYNLWKVLTPGDLCPFMPLELAISLNHQEPRKSPGLDSIFRAYILCWISSQILVMWFLHFLHALTQTSQDLEKSTVVVIPKLNKTFGEPNSYYPISNLSTSRVTQT